MIFRHTHHKTTWIDLENPTEEELFSITREFGIGARIEAELVSPTPLPLVANENDMALLVLHFPSFAGDSGESRDQEIDFVVGKHFVITVHYEIVEALHMLRRLFETEEALRDGGAMPADMLLEVIFAHLFAAVRDHGQHIAQEMIRVENEMFDGRERQTVREISSVSRAFLHLEATLSSQEEPLVRYLRTLSQPAFFGERFSERAGRIAAMRTQAQHFLVTHRAVATELRETNGALLESRQNEIMRTLTVVNFILLPLELIAIIFAMQLPGLPFHETPNGFWIVSAGLVILGLLLTLFAAYKRWIFN